MRARELPPWTQIYPNWDGQAESYGHVRIERRGR